MSISLSAPRPRCRPMQRCRQGVSRHLRGVSRHPRGDSRTKNGDSRRFVHIMAGMW
nr:MAG TPA: hypothetical protein [Caudoviricetes sp.]